MIIVISANFLYMIDNNINPINNNDLIHKKRTAPLRFFFVYNQF